jgi:hypothetical protein
MDTVRDRRPAGGAVLAALTLVAATAVYCGMQWPEVMGVWTSGAFSDTDDAMRMVQVRDLLAGQAWYDLTAWRLDPPKGMVSHWSRLVDAPLAGLILLFQHFFDGVQAERAARIAFPALMTVALFAAGLYAARVFAGRSMRLLGVAAMFFCGVLFWQFPPGRIDHHAPQIVTLLVAVAAMASCFGRADSRAPAALAGAMTALSLAIGLENLPFLALVAAAPIILFVWRGMEARGALHGFALGLGGALLPLYAATIAPERWLTPACDALSGPHVLACLAGCAAYGLIGRFGAAAGAFFRTRIVIAGAAALCAAAPLSLAPAACLADPYHGMDALVRSYWLDPNPEVISIVRQAQLDLHLALLLFVPTLAGLLAALFGAWTAAGASRAKWMFLASQIALGLLLGSLHVRAFSTIMPLAAIGALAPAAWASERMKTLVSESSRALVGGLTAFIVLFALSDMGLTVALPATAANPPVARDRCMTSKPYAPLHGLAPGLAVSAISPGAYLLALTDLSVMAGPYHRANHGNRGALDILFAPPPQAERLARDAGARYVILCWDRPGLAASWKARSPDGLAARIVAGAVPDWLRPVEVSAPLVHVFEVAPRTVEAK